MPSSTTSYCNSVIHEPCRVWEADWLWKLLFTIIVCSMYNVLRNNSSCTFIVAKMNRGISGTKQRQIQSFSHDRSIDQHDKHMDGTRIPRNWIEPLQYHHHGCHQTKSNKIDTPIDERKFVSCQKVHSHEWAPLQSVPTVLNTGIYLDFWLCGVVVIGWSCLACCRVWVPILEAFRRSRGPTRASHNCCMLPCIVFLARMKIAQRLCKGNPVMIGPLFAVTTPQQFCFPHSQKYESNGWIQSVVRCSF